MPSSPKLLDQIRAVCRRKQRSWHTERTYTRWIIRFVRFHDTTHPAYLDARHVEDFLWHLARNRRVADSSRRSGRGQEGSGDVSPSGCSFTHTPPNPSCDV